MPVILKPPRNTICGACYKGARTIISLVNKLQTKKGSEIPSNSCKTLVDVSRWVSDKKDMETALKEEATRSQIFKNMLDSDVCKAPPRDAITLPELNHDELECLPEFLYTGSLPKDKVDKHVNSLSLAADKYEISYLQKFCGRHMLRSLNLSNALDVLEISGVCSYISLKETALKFIAKNMEDIAFSARYEEFAIKNPHLCVQITRASLKQI